MKITKASLLNDLQWTYNRLDHLMTIHKEKSMGKKDFSGPGETMECVGEELPKLRNKYGFAETWPKGRIFKKS